jgi:hypothetical protein
MHLLDSRRSPSSNQRHRRLQSQTVSSGCDASQHIRSAALTSSLDLQMATHLARGSCGSLTWTAGMAPASASHVWRGETRLSPSLLSASRGFSTTRQASYTIWMLLAGGSVLPSWAWSPRRM